jgi:hypothetical protein
MGLYDLTIDGIDHSVYVKTIKEGYHRLCSALMSGISDTDQTKMTNINKNKRKIVYFSDVVRCFEGVELLEHKAIDSCICGKKHIKDNYLIRNIMTREEHIVGSTCAKNWFKENKAKDSCIYCGRLNKSGNNCINCSGKTNLKSVFSKWKSEVREGKEKVSFGKYKNVLTFSQLCNNIQKKDYVDWCLNESQMNDMVKERLRYFANKYRDE